MNLTWVDLNLKSDTRGDLIPVESEKDLPFAMKRVYFIRKTPTDARRGFHAHHQLNQVALCLVGQCDFLMDDGTNKQTATLKADSKALLIPPMIWHEMSNFSSDCLLAVFASDLYDESDYIRTYEDFLREVKRAK